MQLKANKINFKYNEDRYVLKDIDFYVNSGEVVGLVAPSGFGKTTLAKILAGYITPESGEVVFEGCRREKNGYNPVQLIFQHPEKSVNPKWKMKKIINESFTPSKELIEAMYHFFVEPEQIQDKEIIITGSDVNHIKNVIRLKVGDEISISNGIDGRDYRCGIAQITEDEVRCELRFIKEDGVELPVKVCLFQGLPKGDKMELIVQKMVELGVYEIVPVTMKAMPPI